MVLVAIVWLGLMGSFVQGVAPGDEAGLTAEYQQARAAAGRGPADQVRLALWCEAHGLTAERIRHLALAVMAEPTNATARGLLGLVQHDGRWIAPDLLAQANRGDEARAKLLAEYETRRSTAPYTAHGQWLLALWADAHGLPDQAKAHCIAVTRLDPSREAAWKRLGYRKHRGGWATEAQIAAEKAEAEAQQRADRHWRPLLEHQQQLLRHHGRHDQVFETLAAISDPRAVPSVIHVFGGSGDVDQRTAVLILGQISSPLSSLGLAHLAVAATAPDVRGEALSHLAARDVRDFIDPLIRLIRTPLRGTLHPVAGPGTVGELFIEGENYNLRELVQSPVMSRPVDPGRPDPDARDAVLRAWSAATPGDPRSVLPGIDLHAQQRQLDSEKLMQLDRINAQLAEKALEARVAQVRTINAGIAFSNGRILAVLKGVTGQDFGPDRQAWARWSIDHAGYASQSTREVEKPTFTEEVGVAYQTQLSTPPPSPSPKRHNACFAAGTPVRTLDGARPIESLRPGDQVLVQDGRTGVLSYQAVVATFHNPPNATLRIKFGDDEVTATGIHRFWRAGVGWTMARELKAGDLLRTLGGTAAVTAVEPVGTQPVFNLEVAEGRSFFVGRLGALVHDNSLVEATPQPFDHLDSTRKALASTKGLAAH